MKVTKDQFKEIIKEGIKNIHKRILLENEKKTLQKELYEISGMYENEVASPEVMDILSGYLEAALWTEEDEIGPANIESDISNDAKIDSYTDIKNFMNQAGSLLNGIEPSQVGHDLWLTRNGHGAGFWDRGLGEVGEKLTEIANAMGEKHLFWGDDEKIYID